MEMDRKLTKRDSRMRMNVKLAEFDRKIPWCVYLRQFGGATVVNKWKEKEKVTCKFCLLVESPWLFYVEKLVLCSIPEEI